MNLNTDDFILATTEEKQAAVNAVTNENYWKGVFCRFRSNTVSFIALILLILLVLFSFLGPLLVPYGYDEFNKGAENLYPSHYALEDQLLIEETVGSSERRLELALREAEAEKGAPLTSIEKANVRAVSLSENADRDEIIKQLDIKSRPFGYSRAELERIASGERVFPHIFGTDTYGRDILARVMVATRISMLIGFFAAMMVLVIGAIYGAISGYCGGKTDSIMMGFAELLYSLPDMLIVLLISTAMKPALESLIVNKVYSASLVGAVGPNIVSLFIAFAMLYWIPSARIIRGQVLQLKEQEFVIAAKALGAGNARIIIRHLLPNCVGQLLVTACLGIPSAIFLESFLSYLGIGVSAPLASLGSLAANAMSGVNTYPHRLIIPTLILGLIILTFNLIGDGLRDALDPKLKHEGRRWRGRKRKERNTA